MAKEQTREWGLNKLASIDWHQDAIEQDEILSGIRNSGVGQVEMLTDYVAYLLEANVRLWGLLHAVASVLAEHKAG